MLYYHFQAKGIFFAIFVVLDSKNIKTPNSITGLDVNIYLFTKHKVDKEI